MFITNALNPGEMLAELLKGRKVSPQDTGAFAGLRHDKDLCPTFARQVSMMLDVYRAYGQEVHDMQSFRDDGVDVLLRYEDAHGSQRLAGIQIKSDDEFCKWEKEKLPLVATLKSQYATAFQNVRLDEYYVLLCVDAVRHQGRIRTVCSELKNFAKLTIVEPQDLLDLYEMDGTELWGRATRLLCHNDTVLKLATEEVDGDVPDVGYFLVALVCRAFSGDYHVTDADLFELWSEWLEFSGYDDDADEERLAAVLGQIDNRGILERDGDGYVLKVDQLPLGISALYFDLRVRMQDRSRDMRGQLLSLLDFQVGDSEDED
jgi:hypothetical protein